MSSNEENVSTVHQEITSAASATTSTSTINPTSDTATLCEVVLEPEPIIEKIASNLPHERVHDQIQFEKSCLSGAS